MIFLQSIGKLRPVGMLAGVAVLLAGLSASAVTITYVNTGPQDSRVFVGFMNNSSGYTTSDFIADPFAFSRADTAFGPLPPAGQLPNFDAVTDARAELGTNLNAPLGTGIRSVFAPLTTTFSCEAHGETLQATGTYSSNSFMHSGDTTATAPMPWIVHVDPSGVEVPGTPTNVTINASIAGQVSVAGASVADANWTVSTTSFGAVMAGSANQSVPGTTPYSDSGTLTFTIPLGSTFELLVDYDLATSGGGAGANSTAEIMSSLVEISAAVVPPPPPPVLPFLAVLSAPIGTGTTPVGPAGPFRQRRTIPVKFQLTDDKGTLIPDEKAQSLDVRLNVFYEKEGAKGSPIETDDKNSDIGDSFRYDADADQFIFNLGTKAAGWLPDYTYRLEISVDGKVIEKAYFALR